MDLSQLRTAITLLQHRTVNRTATAQGLAPSSVSDRVRRLEAELGASLFTRDRSGMHPTAAGRSYLGAAAAALDLLDTAAERLDAKPGLVVGAQASIADEILPGVMNELGRAHPDLEVHLRPDPDRARLLALLEHCEIDAAVILDTGDDIGDLGFSKPISTMDYLDIREVPMTVVATPGNPLLGRSVSMEEIQQTGGLIGREPRCSFWMATQRWLGPDVDLTAVGGLAQVREWVATGKGIALLPEFAVRADLDSGRVMKVDVRTPPLQLRLIWLQGREATSSLRPLLYALTRA